MQIVSCFCMTVHLLLRGLLLFTFSWVFPNQPASVTSKKSPKFYKSCPKMISLEKWKILRPLQNLPRNVGDLGKLIAAKGFKKLPKVQKIAKSGHTGRMVGRYYSLLSHDIVHFNVPLWPFIPTQWSHSLLMHFYLTTSFKLPYFHFVLWTT